MTESNYERMFGTPERAARTACTMSECCGIACLGCPMEGVCDNEGKLLEWLRGDA